MNRGLRNNNPANIRKGEPWVGLACVQDDKDFCVFKTTYYGIRAMVITLRTYVKIHRLYTIEKIISRWAPPKENATALYIHNVKRGFFCIPTFSSADFEGEGSENLYTLCKLMCQQETGYFLPEWQFREVMRKLNVGKNV